MEKVKNFKDILENSNDINQLKNVIKEINLTQKKEFFPLLIDFILRNHNNSDFLNLKVLAIKVVAKYKNPDALPCLLCALNDKNSNYKIRLAAAEALGNIGDKIAFESLVNIAKDDEEKSTYVKESAIAALGMLGDKRAINVFNSIINTKQMFLDKFTYLKEKIIEAMSKLEISKDEKALNILKTSLMDPSQTVRIAAIETLMNSNIKNSYSLIYDRLKFDDNFEVKKNALIALYNLSDRKILDEVIKSDDFDWDLKKFAKELIDEYE